MFYERDISLPVVSTIGFSGPIGISGPGISLILLGTWDFPYFKFGIRDLKAKSGRVLGLKVCTGGWTPKITLGITGLHEILGRDYEISE